MTEAHLTLYPLVVNWGARLRVGSRPWCSCATVVPSCGAHPSWELVPPGAQLLPPSLQSHNWPPLPARGSQPTPQSPPRLPHPSPGCLPQVPPSSRPGQRPILHPPPSPLLRPAAQGGVAGEGSVHGTGPKRRRFLREKRQHRVPLRPR